MTRFSASGTISAPCDSCLTPLHSCTDNGFLPYPDNNQSVFAQRTLVARFAMNHSKPPTVETVRKPVLNAMALMSKLGSLRFRLVGGGPASTARLGGIATLNPVMSTASSLRNGEQVVPVGPQEAAVVLYSSDDSAPSYTESITTVNLTLAGNPVHPHGLSKCRSVVSLLGLHRLSL